MAKPMTPLQAYKNSNPGAPIPRSMMSPTMDESKKHETTKGDKKEDKTEPIKKSGTYKGKSNVLGYGGRVQQLKDRGVPGGVIGNLARAANAAPGQKNYHGGKKSA